MFAYNDFEITFLTISRYDLGTPLFLGLVGCFLILLGVVFYAATVYRVIFPERYSNSSSIPIPFLVVAEVTVLLTLLMFGLAVKWCMIMEEAHT